MLVIIIMRLNLYNENTSIFIQLNTLAIILKICRSGAERPADQSVLYIADGPRLKDGAPSRIIKIACSFSQFC